jgi:hypothetical protein
VQTDIARIILRLAEAVQRLPLDTMVLRVWFPGEYEITQNVHELEAGARDAITRLSTLAGAGRDDAAVALRNIGNLAATELESFILLQASKVSRRSGSATPGPFKASAVFSRPVVEINGDLSSVVEVLRSEEQAIARLSDDEIKDQVENQRIAGRGRFVVNALAALGFPKELLDEHRRRTSEKSVHYNHPIPILEAQLAITKTVKGETDPQKRPEAVRIELLKLTQHLLEARLEELSIAKAAGLSPKSLEWPVCVSAFGRDTQEKVESLKLGSAVRFRPRGVDNKTGRPTVVEPGSVIHFALEYCIALDDARRMHLNSTKQERADWSNSIDGIEEAVKKGVGGDSAKKLLAQPSKPNRSDPYHGVSLCILWTYKAALLPVFPSMDDLKNADHATADLELWIDAAVARARMICWNDWEGYIGWPTCVVERRFQSKKRGRSAQSVVREKLREGMLKLEPVSSANR